MSHRGNAALTTCPDGDLVDGYVALAGAALARAF